MSGTGISTGTIATYVDRNTMTLSILPSVSIISDVRFYKATIDNQTTINMGAGVFLESSLEIFEYVIVKGILSQTVISSVQPSIIRLHKHTFLDSIVISGSTGSIGILIDSSGETLISEASNIHNVSVLSCNVGIKCISATNTIKTILYNSSFLYCTTSISIDGTAFSGNHSNAIICNNIYVESGINSVGLNVSGPNAEITMSNSEFVGNHSTGSIGFQISDGSECNILSSIIKTFDTGIYIPSFGAGPNINLSSISVHDCVTSDCNIQSSSVLGILVGNMRRARVTINSGSTLTVNITDPVENGTIIPGRIYSGTEFSTITNIVPAIQSGELGLLSGGNLSISSGLVLNITDGSGYVISNFTNALTHIVWATQTASVPYAVNYITVVPVSPLTRITESSCVVEVLSSYPDNTRVYLGKVIADGANINIIDQTPILSSRVGNRIDTYNRTVFGAMYVSGSTVSFTTSPNPVILQFSISEGLYYLSELSFTPSGKSLSTIFYPYYHSTPTVFTRGAGTNVVDNVYYDNITGGLTPLNASWYTKHSIYTVGQGVNEQYLLVYGQSQYSTQLLAESGPLPLAPSDFTDGIVLIASIVVQQGNSYIVSSASQRPLPSFSASAISASVYHGNLLGLTADDHPQYLLVNGIRAMSGNLDMGNNLIINAGTINGVTIAAHASRHQPSGSDPLTTAAPIIPLTATDSAYIGTADSFSRSDHVHAISTSIPSTQQPGLLFNITGTSSGLARADHLHQFLTQVSLPISATGTEGVAITFARGDHTHQGVHSVNTQYGDIQLQSGTGVIVRNYGGNSTFTFDTSLTGLYNILSVGDLRVGTGTFVSFTGATLFARTITAATGIFNIINSVSGTIGAFTSSLITSNTGIFNRIIATTGRFIYSSVGTGTFVSMITTSGRVDGALALTAESNQLTFGTANILTINTTVAQASTYNIPDVGSEADFVMSQADQNVSGVKTFTSGILFPSIKNATEPQTLLNVYSRNIIQTTFGGFTSVILRMIRQGPAVSIYTYGGNELKNGFQGKVPESRRIEALEGWAEEFSMNPLSICAYGYNKSTDRAITCMVNFYGTTITIWQDPVTQDWNNGDDITIYHFNATSSY